MEANLAKLENIKVKNTIENLGKNGIKAVFVPSKDEALALLKTLLVPGEKIAVGGSVTLSQIGALELIRSNSYRFIDRYEKNVPNEVIAERLREGLTADTFLTSSNAITETGCLYNVDGSGNRTAAFLYGPKRVLVFAGINKIVPSLKDAVERVKTIAAPANAIRLDRDTYCSKKGRCFCTSCSTDFLMTLQPGECKNTICRSTVVTSNQVNNNRITVILIGESLGY